MKQLTIALTCLIIITSGIVISKQFNWWQTTSTKVPAKIQSGEYAGQYDPYDIRGSYTFGDIATNFGIEAQTLANAFHIDTDNPTLVVVKNLETLYPNLPEGIEIGTDSIRMFVAIIKQLPIESIAKLPTNAVEYLKAQNLWDSQWDSAEVAIQGTYVIGSTTETTETISASSTVNDVLKLGMTIETLEQLMNIDITNNEVTIKALCEQHNLQFGTVKTAIAQELSK
jgi:hypothetical protein